MRRHFLFYPSISFLAIAVCFAPFFLPGWNKGGARAAATSGSDGNASLVFAGEKHLANVRQLTFGGTNAEAYFSADDKFLTFQHQGQFYDPATHANVGPAIPCDQIYTMPVPSAAGGELGEMKW